MNAQAELVRGWFQKAESDLATARRVLDGEGPFDTACFHAQQMVEKYLKGLLAYFNQAIPHTHNLEELETLCKKEVSDWPFDDGVLAALTPYAVQMRYDFEFWPDRETAEEAVAVCEKARHIILSIVPENVHPQ